MLYQSYKMIDLRMNTKSNFDKERLFTAVQRVNIGLLSLCLGSYEKVRNLQQKYKV